MRVGAEAGVDRWAWLREAARMGRDGHTQKTLIGRHTHRQTHGHNNPVDLCPHVTQAAVISLSPPPDTRHPHEPKTVQRSKPGASHRVWSRRQRVRGGRVACYHVVRVTYRTQVFTLGVVSGRTTKSRLVILKGALCRVWSC